MANEKVGVVLSGCGHYDGAEIREAIFTLLALDERHAHALCMAPNTSQMHVVDHITGETGGTRNVLSESARIARGDIRDLAAVSADELDALIFPGGYGVAKNLCDFAVRGAECSVHPEVSRLVREMHTAGKPLGFVCIAPAMAAAIFREAGVAGVQMTIGDEDTGTARALETLGAVHLACPVGEARVDARHRIVSTPAYMYSAPRISEVRKGIAELVDRVLGMTRR
jgi:enhancing lycopene biosynthesis protein 2